MDDRYFGCGVNMMWEPEQFTLETTSVWSFPERGGWATHDAKYCGNWSPYIPRNSLLRYSMEGERILDQFVGGGTTLIEAKLLNRNILGVDINPGAIERCRVKTAFEYPNAGQVYIKQGDARRLDFIPDTSVDFICTHPPYAQSSGYNGSEPTRVCPKCKKEKPLSDFGYRDMGTNQNNEIRNQSWCKACR